MRRWSSIVLLIGLSTTAKAQEVKPRDPTGVIPQFARFADIFGSRLVAAFEAIPAAKYSYRPTPVQQSVGYIAQHLETANYGLCERLGTRHPRTAKDSLADSVKALWPKDTLVARLDASLRFCDDVLQQLGPLNPQSASTLIGFETDLAEHYSQISVYMRLLGLVPPSAVPPKQHTAITLPESALRPFVGRYELNPGWQIVVTMNDGALMGRSTVGGGPAVRLWPESTTDFFVKEIDAQIKFVRGSNGAVSGLVLHQYGRDRRATKLS
jgi:hypothetical protein